MKYLLVFTVSIAATVMCLGQTNGLSTAPTNAGVLAIVLGKTIGVDQKSSALSTMFNSILEKFEADNHLAVAESEVDAYLNAQRVRTMALVLRLERVRKDLDQAMASPVLSEQVKEKKSVEIAQVDELLKDAREEARRAEGRGDDAKEARLVAAETILKWKANQALFKKYGGRIIGPVQQPESFDGKAAYFKEQEAAGAIRILDKNLGAFFWNVLTNEAMYAPLFIPEKDREDVINKPWWLARELVSTNIQPASVVGGLGGNQPESHE